MIMVSSYDDVKNDCVYSLYFVITLFAFYKWIHSMLLKSTTKKQESDDEL